MVKKNMVNLVDKYYEIHFTITQIQGNNYFASNCITYCQKNVTRVHGRVQMVLENLNISGDRHSDSKTLETFSQDMSS
jgi:hypothetical protein